MAASSIVEHEPSAKRQRIMEISAEPDVKDAQPQLTDDQSDAPTASSLGLVCKPPAEGSQTEAEVGILRFIREGGSFYGILKARFSDFLVREISPDGTITHLTQNLSIPEKFLQYEARVKAQAEQSQTPDARAAAGAALCQILGAEAGSLVQAFIENASSSEPPEMRVDVPSDKEARKRVHQGVRELSGGSVLSETSASGEQLVLKRVKQQGKASVRQPRASWPAELPPFVHFTLFKASVDNNAALLRLSKLIGCGPKVLSVAGTKDKRGITVQRVSGHQINIRSLIKANEQFEKDQRQSTLRVSDIAYSDSPLRLGDLSGNHFEVLIRQVAVPDVDLAHAALSLQRHGFINYFGMQRFGTGSESSGTHQVGIALLRGEWKQAFDLILTPQPHESGFVRNAKEHYLLRGDPQSALSALPHSLHLERSLLASLIKHQYTGYFNAISNALPRNVRLMYAHAFQSFVWNTMVSRRMERYGNALAVGDLVFPRKINPQSTTLDDVTELEDSNLSSSSSTSSSNSSSNSSITKSSTIKPILIDNEATLSQYSIEDLVLPLPGIDVVYPSHEVGFEAYAALLSSFGLDINHLQRPQKDLSLSGGYRHAVVVPRDFAYSIRYYDDAQADLLRSDLDVLNNNAGVDAHRPERFTFKAVTLKFSLPAAAYATMCIREFTRVSSVDLR